MKKLTIFTLILIASCTIAMAQPRAIGMRLSHVIGVSYQHSLGEKNMLQIDLEFPLFTHMNVSAIYDWLIPLKCPRGSMNLYAGVGGTVGLGWNLGWQYGTMKYPDGTKHKIRGWAGYGYGWGDYGRGRPVFGIFGVTGHFGFEYVFWFPLQLFADWKLTFGGFVGSWNAGDTGRGNGKIKYSGFYVPGIYNIAIGARYFFGR